jgi:hypothetical protein
LGVFLRASQAPAYPSWISGADSPIHCVGLDQFLPEWLEREPDNPYVAVFAPLVLTDEDTLTARAPALW